MRYQYKDRGKLAEVPHAKHSFKTLPYLTLSMYLRHGFFLFPLQMGIHLSLPKCSLLQKSGKDHLLSYLHLLSSQS